MHTARTYLFSCLICIGIIAAPPKLYGQPLPVPDFIDATEVQADTSPLRNWDWLQLVTGEWLKGEFKTLYQHQLEFDSDQLELLQFDFEDVYYVRTFTLVTVRLQIGKQKIERNGQIILDAKEITIVTAQGPQTFARAAIISIAPDSDGRETNLWSIDVALGTLIKRGNTTQFDYNANIVTKRRSAKSRFSLNYIGAYSEIESTETANSERISASYDIYATQRRFYRPIFAEFLADPFQNIKQKTTLAAGLGFYLFDTARVEWDISIGPGYQSTEFDTVIDAGETQTQSMALVTMSFIDFAITDDIDFTQQYRMQWAREEGGGYTHHSVTSLDFDVTSRVDLGFSLVWDYVQYPEPEEGGDEPVNSDLRLSINISWDFN